MADNIIKAYIVRALANQQFPLRRVKGAAMRTR